MLTDSGGFQMVSLLHLADITEEGVTFQSPVDGSQMLLTPEHSIEIQNRLGADIIMALDDVVPSTMVDPARFEEACHRTTRWIDRCIKVGAAPQQRRRRSSLSCTFFIILLAMSTPFNDVLLFFNGLCDVLLFAQTESTNLHILIRHDHPLHKNSSSLLDQAHSRPTEQNLFAIVQGGLDPRLREISLQGLIERGTPGYAIGGLAGGEDKEQFWRVVAQCADALPRDKPRYVMGIGYPLDIVICTALGCDIYDSVYPTRTARFGVALVPEGTLRLKNRASAEDLRPLDLDCSCMTCRSYTRSYLHHMLSRGVNTAANLVTYHNIAYTQRLTREMRDAIREGRFPAYVRTFVRRHFPAFAQVPTWVREALEHAGIPLGSGW